MSSVEDRFWAKVDKRGPDDCWEWIGAKNRPGYGQLYMKDGQQGAHRVSFFLHSGTWPIVCRHTCDNPGCVNPGHLVDGTHADNMQDRVNRKTGARGTKQHRAVLTEEAVADIRSSDEPLSVLAKRHGCAVPTVWHARHGRTWKHV